MMPLLMITPPAFRLFLLHAYEAFALHFHAMSRRSRFTFDATLIIDAAVYAAPPRYDTLYCYVIFFFL